MSNAPCEACAGIWPVADYLIADLGLSVAYLHDDQFFPGWTVLLFKRHAPTERIQLMEEVSRLAQVLAETFGARKMNYELLGNQLPHIHWHLIPRLSRDPAPLEPVWQVPHDRISLSAEQISTTISLIKKRL